MDKKTYKLSIGITATQEELTIEQDYRLMEILSDLGVDEGKDLLSHSIKDLIVRLIKNDLLSGILNVILTVNTRSEYDWKKLKNSELNQIITDFFSLNPLVLNLFETLRSAQVTGSMNTMSSDSEPNAESLTRDS